MMVDVTKIESVYLIGIGGIGMSALAQYFYAEGCKVSGFDKMKSKATAMLEAKGITVHYDENIKHLDHNPDLIIYTPAIPVDNAELEYAMANFEHVYKRSVVLQEVIKDMYCIAVAGTHGKTTITAMIAHILNYANMKANAFIGGISNNINSNLYYYKGTKLVVVEADEYDRSFLMLKPDIVLINSLDPDHLDVYSTFENMQEAYMQFANKTSQKNRFVNEKCSKYFETLNTYGFNDEAALQVKEYKYVDGLLNLTVKYGNETLQLKKINIFGKINIENLCAALFIAYKLKIDSDKVEAAMQNYLGVKRRFELIYQNKDIILIDDYAHHHVEIDNYREALREVYPNKTICALFQPHLFTRTRDFMDELAQSLSKFDVVYLLNIYPAREQPIDGVSSAVLAEKINAIRANDVCKVIKKKQAVSIIDEGGFEVLTTIGAGDIDKVVDSLKKRIKENELDE